MQTGTAGTYGERVQRIGLIVGPLFLLGGMLIHAPAELTKEAWLVAALGLHMAVWWITEAVPIPVTALLPIALFPLLGVGDIRSVAAPYAHPLIFLFLGGFLLAEAVQESGIHNRLALKILNRIGESPGAVAFGFMVVSGFMSMWVANTATTLMMLPIAISVVDLTSASSLSRESVKRFGTLLMLGIAYSASIGGVGTLIGTPPNALMAAFLEESYGIQIGFAGWMSIGVPIVIVGIPLVYLVLGRFLYRPSFGSIPGGRELFRSELERLGRMRPAEIRVGLVFLMVALAWITRPLLSSVIPGLTDSGIAIIGATMVFIVPSGERPDEKLLGWKQALRIPWGVLLLFGGGLSLAAFIASTGLARYIGEGIGSLADLPPIVLIFLFTSVVIVLTEMTSNTATTAAFLPVLASVALTMGTSPVMFVIPATIAASCAFMLPVATPPNAIVFGTGYFRISTMARTGVYLNVIFAFVVTGLSLLLPYYLIG